MPASKVPDTVRGKYSGVGLNEGVQCNIFAGFSHHSMMVSWDAERANPWSILSKTIGKSYGVSIVMENHEKSWEDMEFLPKPLKI